MTDSDATPLSDAIAVEWKLTRQPSGRLLLIEADGTEHDGIVPVRAFPLTAPGEGISLLGLDGHEQAWVGSLAALPPRWRAMIEEELAQRDFLPEIEQLVSVSTFGTPSVWQVMTDRGPSSFVLKGEEDIRRLDGAALLIASGEGVQYRVRDMAMLDRDSRRLLERFL